MTVEYVDGWDRANTNASLALRGWTVSAASLAASSGRNGQGSALYSTGASTWTIYRDLPLGNLASRVVGLAIKAHLVTDAATMLMALRDGATNQIGIWNVNATGALTVRRGSTVLGTTPTLWTDPGQLDTWRYIELVTTIHNTTGFWELFVDGTSVLGGASASGGVNGSNVDTQESANAYASRLAIGGLHADKYHFDDLYVGDTRLGDRRVVSLNVTSDVAAAWTRSAGAVNYANVDDNPLSTADYNEAVAAGLRDQFAMEDLSYTPQSVDCVAMNYVHNKQDSGARTIRGGVVSGGTTGNGATVAPLLTTNSFQQDLFATDPNTGAAWTKAGIDAAEPFYETVT